MMSQLLHAAYSHLDLGISMLCGFFVFLVMYFLKRPIKRANAKNSKTRKEYYLRNTILLIVAEILGAIMYLAATYFLGKREWTVLSLILAGAWAITIYEIIDLIRDNWRWILLIVGMLLVCEVINYVWTFNGTNHHKFCYSIRIFGIIMMVVGFVRQVVKKPRS